MFTQDNVTHCRHSVAITRSDMVASLGPHESCELGGGSKRGVVGAEGLASNVHDGVSFGRGCMVILQIGEGEGEIGSRIRLRCA